VEDSTWGGISTALCSHPRGKLDRMKIRLISELAAAVTIGILVGLHTNWTHWHWHQLGREAFLSNQSQYFDKFFVNPAPAIHPIATFVVVALVFFAVFKAISFVVSMALSKIGKASASSQI
jgi:hypothetical protein